MVKFQFLRKQKVYNNQDAHQNDFMWQDTMNILTFLNKTHASCLERCEE